MLKHSSLLLSFLLLSSCGPKQNVRSIETLEGLHPRIPVSQIPAVEIPTGLLGVDHKPALVLPQVSDERSTPELISHEDKKILPQGDLGLVVRYVLLKTLRQRGFSIEKEAAVSLHCKISSWRAEVEDGTLKSEATLFADVIGPEEESLYSGVYEGFGEVPSPQLLEKDLQQALGLAMNKALTELINDKELTYLLSSF